MPEKKTAQSKPAAKAAKAAAVKKPATTKAPAKKAAPAAKAKPAAKAPAKPAAKPKAAAKPAPKPKPAPKTAAAKKKAEAKPAKKAAVKPASKPKTAAKPAEKPVKSSPAAQAKTAEKPAPKPEKAEKKAAAPKAKEPKPPKPPKLPPVEAALAKPMPAKPLAVAAGRPQPVARTPLTPPPRVAPKPLSAPKPTASEPETVGDAKPVPAFKAKASNAKGMVLVGAVAGAFGVKGEVRLRAFTDQREGVISYGPLYGEDGKVLLKPKSWRELKDGVAVSAPEVKTREDAEKLRGQRLYVPRANLPPTAEDEFYIVDLLGCRAEAIDGQVLGEVIAVWNFGAGDIIEYRPSNGGPNVRVTFTKDTAPLVDLAGKRVVLDPPAPEPVGK